MASELRIALALLLTTLSLPHASTAASVSTTWNGGAGNWNDTSLWSGGVVPNNGTDTFSVFIDGGKAGNSTVTVNINPTITNLTIDSGDQLSQNNNQSLGIAGGTVINNGMWLLNSGGNITDILCNGGATLSGSGTIMMSDNLSNRIVTNNTVCTNAAGHTIRGAGQLLVNTGGMTNAGTIVADKSNSLIIDPNGLNVTNTGTLRAMNGGTLVLSSGTFVNTMGLIDAQDTSIVAVSTAAVIDGTLNTGGSGEIRPQVSSFSNVTNNGTVNETNNQSGTVTGTLTNNGTWVLNSTGNLTDLYCNGGATLSGSGSIVMSDNGNNRILTDNTACTNALGHTIRGAGQLLVNTGGMVNAGTVVADQNAGLTIHPNGLNFTNTGTLQATSGSTLLLTSGTFINAMGLIEADAMSAVAVSNAAVVEGTMTTNGSGIITTGGGSTFTNVTNTGTVAVPNNESTAVTGTLANDGTWRLNSAGNNTDLNCVGAATLGGTGTLVMSDNGNNRILTNNTQCTNAATHTIRGAGQLLVNTGGMLNKGTIIADRTNPLLIDPNGIGFTNESILQAQDGATLILNTDTFTNTNGSIKALDASVVQISATVLGGQLVTSDTGKIRVLNSTTLDNVTSGATIEQPNNNAVAVTHTLTNNSTWSMQSVGNLTDLHCVGMATITGNGSISMSDNISNRIVTDNTRCTNGPQHTIHGAGQLLANTGGMINNGTIIADLPSGIVIDPNGLGFTNAGLLRAASGGTLTLSSNGFDNSSGLIEALDGSVVQIANGASVTGGDLTASGTGGIYLVAGPLLTDVTTTGTVFLPNNNAAVVHGTLVNNGTWSLNSLGNSTDLYCNAGATLSGPGSIVMSNNGNNRILTDNTACTNALGHTIRGAGQLLVNTGGMVNAGTIIADQNAALVVDPNGVNFANTGTLRAASGGTLILTAGTFVNTNGLIEAQDMSTVVVNGGATLMDGTMTTSGSGIVNVGGGATFTNIASSGTIEQDNNQSTIITGTLTNNSTWMLSSVGNLTDLNCIAGATLGGTGSLTMSNNGNNRILANNTQCTNAVGHTIRGAGQLLANTGGMLNQGTIVADQTAALTLDPNGLGFTNQGTLRAMGSGGITINPDPFTNAGTVLVDTGSSLVRNGTYPQTAGTTTVNGTLNATGLVDIQGGALQGSGTVAANVPNAGQVRPGGSAAAGNLSINGTYTQTAGGVLNVEIGGSAPGTGYDRLTVSGAATLNGTINISLINNFMPVLNSTFTVLTFASHTGDFATYNGLMQSNGLAFSASYTGTSLVLTVTHEAFTPTPTATPTQTPTATRTPTYTATRTSTHTPTATPTRTSTATPSATAPTGSPTVTPTSSRTATQTPTGTATTTPSQTPTQVSTGTATVTPTRTVTLTGTLTATPTNTPGVTSTATSSPTNPLPSASPTPSATPASITVSGMVRIPGPPGHQGPHGLMPAVGVTVEAFVCAHGRSCLDMLEIPVGSAVTDALGQFSMSIPRDVVVGNLLVLRATVDGNRLHAVITSQSLGLSDAPLVRRSAAVEVVTDLIDVDPISEASVRLLADQGLQNFSDSGIDSVNEAVDAANTQSTFDGMTLEAANTAAEMTAANDPAVQMALQDNRFTPTPTATATPIPCSGDCDSSGTVTIDEILTLVNIALDNLPVSTCLAGDAHPDGRITIDEILTAVNNALNQCVPG
jgi:hypothetical protein